MRQRNGRDKRLPQPRRNERAKRLPPQDRREALLEVATRLFSERGENGVSITEVARAAGVARPLVHHYFGSRDELYLAIGERLAAKARETVRTDLDLPIEELVSRNVDAWLDFFEGNRAAITAFVWSHRFDAPVEAMLRETVEELLDRVIAEPGRDAELPPGFSLTIRAYTGLVRSALHDWLVEERASRAEVHALVTEALLALMQSVAPAVEAARLGPRVSRKRPAAAPASAPHASRRRRAKARS